MILTYHKIHPENKTIWWVTPDAFYRQMADLRSKKVVYLDDYDPADKDQVVITFDGVYKDIWKYAVPILVHFGYPFELFIIGGTVGKDNSFDKVEPLAEFADIETLQKMVLAGGRLQWHSWSHARLAGTKDLAVFEKELSISSELHILDQQGFKWYAYPHGERDELYRSQVAARFAGALACDDGNDTDRYDLNRLTVYENTRLTKTTVSLIIPCYNYGHLAAEAIESALMQTYSPDEILFIDDASSDNSLEVARRYEPHIRIVANEKNLGVVENFRKAISMTKGDYIVFLGADNRFRSDYVEQSKAILDANLDVAVVYTHFILFGSRAALEAVRMGAQEHPSAPGMYIYQFPEKPQREIRQQNYIHGSSMYRRSAYDQAGGYQLDTLPEDQSIFARMLDLGWKAKLWDAPALEYRQHTRDQINQLKMYEMENAYLRKDIVALRTENQKLFGDITTLSGEKNSIQNQLESTRNQLEMKLAAMTSQFILKEAELAGIYQSKAWRIVSLLKKIYGVLFPLGSRRSRMISGFFSLLARPINAKHNARLRKEEDLLRSSGLFDEIWYLEKNRDLRNKVLPPIRHYLLFGGLEGRDPSPRFSSQIYLDSYPDVKKARINPLVHYLSVGKNEGRIAYPSDVK